MGLLPLGWCLIHRERRVLWWWIAGAFAISWLADAATLVGYPTWVPASIYPVGQAGLLAVVLAQRPAPWLGLLMVAGIVGVYWEGVTGPTLILDTIAAGVVVRVAWSLTYVPLRLTLLMAFWVGGIAWIGYVLWPGWTSWGLYQGIRAASLGMFCWAQRPMVQLA
jgi:hypothetical protein